MNEEIILNKFAERFSDLVRNSSIDILKLAEMLGIKSKSTIYRYMNGDMAPKISTVKYASEIFNVNPLWLMGYDVPMERKMEVKQSGSNIYYTDPITKETHFVTWPPKYSLKEYIHIFNDNNFLFTLVGNGMEMPCEYFHIKIEDESMNLVAPMR